MLTIGDRFPAFDLKAVVSSEMETAFTRITDSTDEGMWKVYFFYPKDFTFVCPTEIIGFDELAEEFSKRNARVYGASTDSEFVHLAWRRDHSGLQNLKLPLLADIRRDLSQALGILNSQEGVCNRATFIVDPQGIIRYVSVHDLAVGRSPQEVLRVLDALQTGELCACDWKKGDSFIKAA